MRSAEPLCGTPRILCVHQGAELYGSDRSFLQAVEALREGWPKAHIRIVLAAEGPLQARLAPLADVVVVRKLLVLRLATPFATAFKATFGFVWLVAAACREIARADLVYINTVVIADYVIAARTGRAKSIIHAREIPQRKVLPLIRSLIRFAGVRMIYNSEATKRVLAPSGSAGSVVYNGFDAVPGARAPEPPPAGFSRERPLRIVMLGRINRWKGQDLLIDAIAMLSQEDRLRVSVRIVGDAYGEVALPRMALQNQIALAELGDVVTLQGFMADPSEAYLWADLSVVPSRLPEPFGRVAIESMAYGRAVLAAGHGGLVEIIEDGRSGWLLPPGDAAALAAAIREVLGSPELVSRLGEAALMRFKACFTSATMAQRLRDVIGSGLPEAAKLK